jgi:hypothetical protein
MILDPLAVQYGDSRHGNLLVGSLAIEVDGPSNDDSGVSISIGASTIYI